MCLLTVLPMPDLWDAELEKRLYIGADNNPHGNGWAVVQGNQIIVGKDKRDDKAIDAFQDAYRHATGPALFHSRWATHGDRTVTNMHPFPVRKIHDTYIAHNGIMPAEALPTLLDSRSDTRVFADDILPVRFKRLDTATVRDALSKWLRGNKIAILTTNPRYKRQVYIFGVELGSWVDGVWHSNTDYKPNAWTRHYDYDDEAGAFGEPGEKCVWCNTPTVNQWAICTTCGSCQDCFEPQAVCQCYYGDNVTVLGTQKAIEGQTYDDKDWSPAALDAARDAGYEIEYNISTGKTTVLAPAATLS